MQMSIQEILTYLIIASSAGYSLFSFFKIVWPAGKKNAGTCSGQCGGCNAVKFRDELKLLQRKN
jgi:hypothetical protein